jgi:hypothetical protein
VGEEMLDVVSYIKLLGLWVALVALIQSQSGNQQKFKITY